jgi:autotransporter passenger strand-loop-strand repeat protein
VTSGATVSGGGVLDALNGGIVRGASILGGSLVVSSGGSAGVGTVLSSGATETVLSGGTIGSTEVLSGATLTVSSGATVAGGITLSGGKAVISGAIGAGLGVTFSGSGGVLVLDNLSAFAGEIAGMSNPSQMLDLGGFAYGTGETVSWTEAASNTSGTLTVTDGAKVAKLTLLGSYVTSNFTLSTDNAGGTYVVDPPAPSMDGATSDDWSGPGQHQTAGAYLAGDYAGAAAWPAGFGPEWSFGPEGDYAGLDLTSAVLTSSASALAAPLQTPHSLFQAVNPTF